MSYVRMRRFAGVASGAVRVAHVCCSETAPSSLSTRLIISVIRAHSALQLLLITKLEHALRTHRILRARK